MHHGLVTGSPAVVGVLLDWLTAVGPFLVVWLAAVAGLTLLGLPLAARVFPRAAGRGAGFALPISLVVLAFVAHWVGHLAYGPPALIAGLLVLGGTAAVAGLDRAALADRRLAVAPDIDVDRRAVGEVAVVFVVAFVFLATVRSVDPAIQAVGGEKFLDFGLLQSLARAETLPPEDVWFAGEPVKYYYGGHLVAHLLAMLTGTPPRVAYNLALAAAYATLVAAAFELAAALAADRGLTRRPAGLLAAFLVGIASNLYTTVRLVVGWLPSGLARDLAIAANVPLDQLSVTPRSFFYWDASRVIPGTVNEFPLFGFLNGDLHAHMTGTPFFLLGVALAAAYYRTPAAERRRRLALAFGAVPLVASFGAVANTWSYPSYFGVLFLAATFAPAGPVSLLPPRVASRVRDRLTAAVGATVGEELLRPVGAVCVAAGAGVVASILAAPFLVGAAASGSERSIAILAASERSTLGGLLLVHGGFLLPFAVYLADRLAIDRVLPALAGLAAVVVVAGAANLPVAILAGPLFVAGWAALRLRRAVGFETVLLLGGLGLVTVVELVYLQEQAGPLRFNTVFKTYAQVWLLLAVGTAVAVPALARRAPPERGPGTADAPARMDDHESRGTAVTDGSGRTDPDEGPVDRTADGAADVDANADAGADSETVTTDRSGRDGASSADPKEGDRDDADADADADGEADAGGTETDGDDDRPPVVPGAASGGDDRGREGGLGATSTRRRLGTLAVTVTLLVATSTYGALALGNHFDAGRTDDPTLDALAVAEDRHPQEAAAIAWLDAETGDRQPAIASAPATSFYPGRGGGAAPGMYSWSSSPAASLTGVPTVAGWAHEVGYRGQEAYYDRVADVDTVYTGSADRQAALLAEYDVRYVWIGSGERARYGLDAITVDDRPFVELAHRTGDVRVYRVRTDRLPADDS
jgi:YYY domain-containing protein